MTVLQRIIEVREGWRLVLTCEACPEQYDLLDHQNQDRAYFRLRWGHFAVRCPDVGGELVYVHDWPDEEYKGIFTDEAERREHLAAGVDAADRWWRARAEGVGAGLSSEQSDPTPSGLGCPHDAATVGPERTATVTPDR